jgi:hypothetical protein
MLNNDTNIIVITKVLVFSKKTCRLVLGIQGSDPSRRRRMNRITKKAVLILFLCLLVVSMVSPNALNAAGKKKTSNEAEYVTTRITTVKGLIENISDDSIVVNDKRYTITGIPLVKPSGELAKKDELSIGAKVEIFFKDKMMSSILIYENVVE